MLQSGLIIWGFTIATPAGVFDSLFIYHVIPRNANGTDPLKGLVINCREGGGGGLQNVNITGL